MKLLIFGADGQLGLELQRLARDASIAVTTRSKAEADVTRPREIEESVRASRPSLAVNAAAYTNVDRAEAEPDRCFDVNRDGAQHVAVACQRAGIPLLHVSTDYIFDGTRRRPYTETDAAAPLSVYGASKLAGETAVRENSERHIVFRTSWLFSPHGRNLLLTVLRLAREGRTLRMVDDQASCPTAAEDAAKAILVIARRVIDQGFRNWGVYHYAGANRATPFEFAAAALEGARQRVLLDRPPLLERIGRAEFEMPAERPAFSVLSTRKAVREFGVMTEDWEEAVHRVLDRLVRNGNRSSSTAS